MAFKASSGCSASPFVYHSRASLSIAASATFLSEKSWDRGDIFNDNSYSLVIMCDESFSAVDFFAASVYFASQSYYFMPDVQSWVRHVWCQQSSRLPFHRLPFQFVVFHCILVACDVVSSISCSLACDYWPGI